VLGDNPSKKIIIQYSIHAREYLTTLVAIEQIEHLKNFELDGMIYFVPLINPDGVKVVLDGVEHLSPTTKSFVKSLGDNNALFKCNIHGVDLNTNFDACFKSGKQNISYPNYQNYTGTTPNSEPETQALTKLTKLVNPDLTISYHLKGEVVYYGFVGQSPQNDARDELLAHKIAKFLNYKPIRCYNSAGGYKDYCSVHYGMPSFTIEVGNDKYPHPYPLHQRDVVINQNRNLPLYLLKLLEKI